MKRIVWVILLARSLSSMAQIGVSDSLGISSIATSSTVGIGDTLGASSIPVCNASLTTCTTALPVNFLEFTGKRENAQYVGLEWKTTSEVQNAGYWVQRSFDNAANFHPGLFVPALDNTDLIKIYQTPDTNAYHGTTYYRLQQLDLDGNTTYSKTIAIDGYPAVDALNAYPNPTHGLVYLQYPPTIDGRPYEIRVFTSFGQILYDGRANTIDLSSHASGVYIIECLADKPIFTKIILLK